MTSLFYDLVPKSQEENLEWRILCRERALIDERFRMALLQACEDDVLFFFAFCIGKGTRVVTDRGPVAIESIRLDDLLWDGAQWVSHQGVLCQGRKPVIFAYDINVTPDHKIWTKHGWKIASEGHDREGVWIPDGYQERWSLPKYDEGSVEVPVPVWSGSDRMRRQLTSWSYEELWMPKKWSDYARKSRYEHILSLEGNDCALHQTIQPSMGALRRSRYQSVRSMDDIRELPFRHGRASRGNVFGSYQQQRKLRTEQLQMGNVVATDEQSASSKSCEIRNFSRSNDNPRDCENYRSNTTNNSVQDKNRVYIGSNASSEERVEEVYDILNCGPRKCFTVLDANDRPLLVHNCLWVYEPREKIKTQPFIPWGHQENVILGMDDTITEAMDTERPVSATVKKSRAQGGTYTYLGVQIRRALFEQGFSSGLVTRNEKMVDSKDPSAVMNKLSTMLDKLPYWMLDGYERNSSDHTIRIPETDAIWIGYAATGDVARGGRTTMFAFDEVGSEEFIANGLDYRILSSVAHVTNCIFLCSTFGADSGVFYESAMDADNPRVYTLDWKDNPEHSKLAYVKKDGVVTAVRPEEQSEVDAYIASHQRELRTIERRGHKIEGKVRSPWYDSHCVAGGTLVVTDRGLVPIENVTLNDRVWDGNMWVSHDGCVYKGCKETIRSYRVGLTPDHRVFTVKGWKHAIEGFDREDIRLPDGYREKWLFGWQCCMVMQVSMWNRENNCKQSLELWKNSELWVCSFYESALQNCNIQFLGCDDSTLHESKSSEVSVIRSAWDNSMRAVDEFRELSRGYGYLPRGINSRQDRKQWELLAEQLPVGDTKATAEQSPEYHVYRDIERNGSDSGYSSRDGNDDQRDSRPHQEGLDGGCSFASTQNPQPVYDLLNCGPRRAFTVIDDDGRPLLVHNCLIPGATPRYIARELDMDAKGSAGKAFSTELLDRVKLIHCKRPVWRGVPVFDEETLELKGLLPRDDGPLTLWFKPSIDHRPPLGPFTVACDIASGGVGELASNSVASGIDNRTGEQVLEYVIKGLEPRPFARRAVGLSKWLRNALLGWEDSGVSGGFAKEVMEVLYYGNVYFRDVLQLGSQKKSRKPGFPCRDADKADMFELFALAMEEGQYTPRSEEMIVECGEYEWDGGKIVHAPTKNKGATEKNHGDRAIAAAGAWLVFNNENAGDKVDSSDETGQNAEYGSFLWREQQERRSVNSGSPSYGIRDVMRE